MSVRSVAVIGLGAMGAPMAQCILKAGFGLTVCDIDPARAEPLARQGARVAATPAQCAQADLVIVMVATAGQVRETVLGPQGLRAGLAAGDRPLVAVMSTIAAEDAVEIGREAAAAGMRLIDAPVSGGVLRAEQGTLTIMSGGPAPDIAQAESVFACLGTEHFHCGELGAGETVKIINNLLSISNAVLSAEAFRLALGKGLDLVRVARILNTGSGRNDHTANPDGPQARFARMAQSRGSFDAMVSIMRKDLALALEMAGADAATFPALRGMEAAVQGLDEETFQGWRAIAQAPSTP